MKIRFILWYYLITIMKESYTVTFAGFQIAMLRGLAAIGVVAFTASIIVIGLNVITFTSTGEDIRTFVLIFGLITGIFSLALAILVELHHKYIIEFTNLQDLADEK